MVKENKELMAQAREALSGKWGLAVGAFLVYMLIGGASIAISRKLEILSLLVTVPMELGIAIFSLSLARKQEAEVKQIFEGFQNYGNALLAYILMMLFTILWTLVLIIPGIIAAISYSQVFYILAEDKSIRAIDAINKSKKMMDGYKWKYFCLQLRFIGWALLCVLTLGIGFLWLAPYIHVSSANFYDDIKDNKLEE